MGMTIAEKILARSAGRAEVKPHEYIDAKLDGIMGYETFVDVQEHMIDAGLPGGLPRLWDRDKFFLMLEHEQPATNLRQAERGQKLRALAKQYEVTHFYDLTCGICHQMMVDYGHVVPGQLMVGSDSHSTLWSALNCASTGIGETDLAFALTFGELWFMVPESIKLELTGKPPAWPVAKDVMLYLAGKYGEDFGLYKSIEVLGPGADALSMDSRFCISDHADEVGAKFGIFACDDKTMQFLKGRTDRPFEPVSPDSDAVYSASYQLDLSTLGPQVAAPHSFSNVSPVGDVLGTRIDQAALGSCANGRFEDIAVAARIVKGRKVHRSVRFLVQPASWDVYRQCMRAGLLETLLEAGAQVLDPGCGLCIGTRGHLGPGDVCISTTTRNYQGRMGSTKAEIYLAGPATVAWSAVTGAIADPRDVLL